MATDSKDIELRVRARDYSGKTFKEVGSALKALTDAQDAQITAASKGQASNRELEDSYRKIESAVTALAKQHALTQVFQQQAAALEEAKAAAEAARKAQEDFANSTANVESKSKAQIKTQRDLAAAVARTEKAQLSAQTRVDKTTAKLAEYGIAAKDVAISQGLMAVAVRQGNTALETQQTLIDANEGNMRAAAQAAQESAAQQRKAAAEEAAAQKIAADAANTAAKRRAQLLTLQNQVEKTLSDQAKAEAVLTNAMKRSADQADASAKGYATLARSIKSVRGDELADQLRGITDPAGTARSNLKGLEDGLTALVAKIGQGNKPVKEFRATLAALEATMKGVGGIGAQIDAYRRQIDVLRAARTEYSQAQAAVRALTAQMRAGGGDAAELSKQLAAAQNTLRSSAAVISTQVSKTRDLREALRAAGVDTRDMAKAEEQLVDQANRAAKALETLTNAYQKHGAATEGAAKKQGGFFSSTRTTLSYTQRLRGELLALATAYIGIQGAINSATGALDAYRTAQKVQGQLGAAFGTDAEVIRKEWDYLIGAANRLGISFAEAAPAYAKFAIAAKAFGFNGADIRKTFEGLAKASTVAGLSASEFEGVLKAVEQMLSKGTIQAEELRGQLGDRLPGAFTLMAAATGRTGAELSKAMEEGKVGAEELLPFIDKLNEKFVLTDDKLNGLQASQARFNNALFEFQLAVANSGFADAYTKLLTDLATLMKSADGKAFAKQLSDAFTGVVSVIRFLIDHVEELKIAMAALSGILVANWAFGAATGLIALLSAMRNVYLITSTLITAVAAGGTTITALGTAATATAGGVGILRTALLLLTRTVPLLAALTAGILAAKYAYDKLTSAKAKSEGKMNTGGATGSWDAKGTVEPDGPGAEAVAAKRKNEEMEKDLAKNQVKLDKDRIAARKKSAKEELDARAGLIKEEYDLRREAAKKEVKDVDAQAKLLKTIGEQEQQAIQTDKIRFDAENAKSGEAAAKKEVGLREQIKNELLRIQDDLIKQETKLDTTASFEERKKARLDAISHTYDKLKKQIAELSTLDKAGAADATKKLTAYIGQLQAVEAQKVTLDEVKRLEAELTDQQKLRDSLLAQEQTKYDAGIISQEQFLANTSDINTRLDQSIKGAADRLQDFVDKAVAANSSIISLTDQAAIKATTTTAKVAAGNTDNKNADAATALEIKGIDQIIAKREAADAIYKAQFEARMISEDEYAAKVNANADQYKTKTLEMIQAVLQHMEAQRALGIVAGTLSQERLAQLDAQIAKMQQLGITIAGTAQQANSFQRTLNDFTNKGLDASLNALTDSLYNIATGQKTVAEGFRDMISAVGQFVAQFLLDIAKAIAKQLILNALVNSGNPYLAAAGTAAGGVARKHSGGVVGNTISGRTQKVDPSWFTNAPRFHEGGLPGLKSNEVPAILQKGEEVLARDDPANVLNGGRQGAGAVQQPNQRFVLLDDKRNVAEAMQSAEGEQAVLVHLKKNAATLRQLIGK